MGTAIVQNHGHLSPLVAELAIQLGDPVGE
jgi:hypothetical protein